MNYPFTSQFDKVSVALLPPSTSFLQTLLLKQKSVIVDFLLLKYEHVLVGFIGEMEQTIPHNFAFGDEWVTPLTQFKVLKFISLSLHRFLQILHVFYACVYQVKLMTHAK